MGLKVKDPNGEWRSTGGGVSDWNDLENRPFYDNEDGSVGKQLDDKYLSMLEKSINEVIPEQEMEFTYNDSLGVYQNGGYNLFNITLGETYEVVWGDQSFTCTAFEGSLDGVPCVAIGNPLPVGGENNDLPFIIGAFAADGVVLSVVVPLDANTSMHIWVYQPLDEYAVKMSYLPDALYTEIDNRIDAYMEEALGGEF